ncbi:hypothetical protein OK016_22435 [Vibrio chagasii]|nr:hypothetical protein [Vibrio chagasii]
MIYANDWDVKQIHSSSLTTFLPMDRQQVDFQNGIDSAFKQSFQSEVKLSIEHLDTKRIHSQQYYDSLVEY